MRALPLVVAALSISILTGCTSKPENVDGDAGPAGSPAGTASATASASAAPSADPTPARSTPGATPGSPRGNGGNTTTFGPPHLIRNTDWANVTLPSLRFMDLGEMRFRNGTASSGPNNCTMLPGGARPVYAEYITEEPANSPVTEDALILIECGSDGMDQALIPVKLGYDQRTRLAMGFIPADIPTGPNNYMTFISYTVEDLVIVTTVRRTDGGRETRRYRNGGGSRWERF